MALRCGRINQGLDRPSPFRPGPEAAGGHGRKVRIPVPRGPLRTLAGNGSGEESYTISIITEMMASTDDVTSIPVHQSTLRALRGTKMADQKWDDFLLALADDFISPSIRADLDRRLRTEPIISGAEMKREFVAWRRRRARS
jgi:hypothetical protein